jgi:TnpA family transposase
VLNRGEAVNALKRAIYTGRVGPAQARRADEMQAVADALSLRIPRDPGRRSALMPDSIPP